MHSEWYVFIGGSCKDRRYLFCTVRKPSVFESAGLGVLNVFMEPKISKDNCNYRIEYSEEMCTIYAGESDTVIAKVTPNITCNIFSTLPNIFQTRYCTMPKKGSLIKNGKKENAQQLISLVLASQTS